MAERLAWRETSTTSVADADAAKTMPDHETYGVGTCGQRRRDALAHRERIIRDN
jgi:hypothetical protein